MNANSSVPESKLFGMDGTFRGKPLQDPKELYESLRQKHMDMLVHGLDLSTGESCMDNEWVDFSFFKEEWKESS